MPNADPPSSSAIRKPVHPSSAICRHSSRENPSGSLVSRNFRNAVTGLRSRKKSSAVSRTIRASSDKLRDIGVLFV
jgi:hypothetical protein